MQHLNTERTILHPAYTFLLPEEEVTFTSISQPERLSWICRSHLQRGCSMALSFGLTGRRIGSGIELLIANLLCASHVRETAQ